MYQLLPAEILVEIFQYLEFDDLKNISLTCKSWLYATQITKISKNFKLCFSFVTISYTNSEPLKLFSSDRVFTNIYFENTKFLEIDETFWTKWGLSITEITFDYKYSTPDLPGCNFTRILLYTPNLKTLNLVCCLHWFNQFIAELDKDERTLIFNNLKKVTELCLYFSETCIDVLNFEEWIDEMSQLKNIDFDLKSTKRKINVDAYEKVFNFLKKYSKVIKGLHICDNSRAVDKKVVDSLLEINDIKLKAFDLIINSKCISNFNKFLKSQNQLLYLTVSGPFSPSTTLPFMPKLKEIAISNGGPVDGFKAFDSQKIESLGIAGLEFHSEFIDDPRTTFNMTKNSNLKELYLIDATIEFSTNLVKEICRNFSCIRLLNIDAALIDDGAFHQFFNLVKLEEFKFSRTEISDYGILGSCNMKKSKKPRLSVIEENSNISNLKQLIVLNLDFCKRITDLSLKKSFQFKKLKHLSVQGCLFTEVGFAELAKHNPQIESLNLSKSTHINDNCIATIAKKFCELETLEIAGCTNVSEESLKFLIKYCKKLQTVDVTKCQIKIEQYAKEMFEKISSLRRIILQDKKLYRCNFLNK